MSKSIILVTGSSGFCGGVLIPKLKNLGYKTIGIDCLPGPYTDIVQDINSPIKIGDDIEAVFHLAAKLEHDRCSSKDYYLTNVLGTNRLLDIAIKHEAHFIYVSTTAIYGSPQSPISEDTKVSPDGDYALTKYLGEKVCHRSNYSKISIVRPSVLIGKKRLGIYNVIFNCLFKNLPIPVLGNGKNKISFVNIDDFCNYLIHVFTKRIYSLTTNFGGRIPGEWNSVLNNLRKHTNSESFILYVPLIFLGLLKILSSARILPVTNWQLSVMYKDYFYSDDKMLSTGYEYQHETIDALKDMADYYESKFL